MTAEPRGGGQADAARHVRDEAPSLFIEQIGWSREEALQTRARLAAFEEDWDAPGMDAYDEL